MNIKEIKEFTSKTANLTLQDMKKKEIIASLASLYVLLGDLFKMKLPHGTKELINLENLIKLQRSRNKQ